MREQQSRLSLQMAAPAAQGARRGPNRSAHVHVIPSAPGKHPDLHFILFWAMSRGMWDLSSLTGTP